MDVDVLSLGSGLLSVFASQVQDFTVLSVLVLWDGTEQEMDQVLVDEYYFGWSW